MAKNKTNKERELQKELEIVAASNGITESIPDAPMSNPIEQARIDLNKRAMDHLFPEDDDLEKNRKISEVSKVETAILSNGSSIDDVMGGMGIPVPKYHIWQNDLLKTRVSVKRQGREETIRALETTKMEEPEESRLMRMMSIFPRMGRMG